MFFRAASPPASRKGSLSCIKGSSGGADGNGNCIIPFVRPFVAEKSGSGSVPAETWERLSRKSSCHLYLSQAVHNLLTFLGLLSGAYIITLGFVPRRLKACQAQVFPERCSSLFKFGKADGTHPPGGVTLR